MTSWIFSWLLWYFIGWGKNQLNGPGFLICSEQWVLWSDYFLKKRITPKAEVASIILYRPMRAQGYLSATLKIHYSTTLICCFVFYGRFGTQNQTFQVTLPHGPALRSLPSPSHRGLLCGQQPHMSGCLRTRRMFHGGARACWAQRQSYYLGKLPWASISWSIMHLLNNTNHIHQVSRPCTRAHSSLQLTVRAQQM